MEMRMRVQRIVDFGLVDAAGVTLLLNLKPDQGGERDRG
jgi:hypothetical protein